MTDTLNGTAGAASATPKGRRKRRTREEVAERIEAAGRQLFAKHGYAATTTREIARLADVSETLVFRYYGDKARLFDTVVSEPFNRLVRDFGSEANAGQNGAAAGPDARLGLFGEVYDLLSNNKELLSAAFTGRPTPEGESSAVGHGFEPFFSRVIADQSVEYDKAGVGPGFDAGMGIRLTFGMMAAAVLMQDWLFPGNPPDREEIVNTLEKLVLKALAAQASN